MPESDPLFLKPEQAAARLNIGRTRVFAAIAAGELRSVKLGRSRLIPAGALLEYAEHIEAIG